MDTKWLKSRKRELKITDDDVAIALGVERSVANKVVNGKVAVNAMRVGQLADLFQTTSEEILFRAGISDVEPLAIPRPQLLSSSDITVWGRVAAGIWMEESFVEPIKVPRSDDPDYCDSEISIVGVVIREVRDHSRRLRH